MKIELDGIELSSENTCWDRGEVEDDVFLRKIKSIVTSENHLYLSVSRSNNASELHDRSLPRY